MNTECLYFIKAIHFRINMHSISPIIIIFDKLVLGYYLIIDCVYFYLVEEVDQI
jgi:hypothetical protein